MRRCNRSVICIESGQTVQMCMRVWFFTSEKVIDMISSPLRTKSTVKTGLIHYSVIVILICKSSVSQIQKRSKELHGSLGEWCKLIITKYFRAGILQKLYNMKFRCFTVVRVTKNGHLSCKIHTTVLLIKSDLLNTVSLPWALCTCHC